MPETSKQPEKSGKYLEYLSSAKKKKKNNNKENPEWGRSQRFDSVLTESDF